MALAVEALCTVVGVVRGQLLPSPFQALGRMGMAKVNLPVGLLIWVMILPMLMRIDFGAPDQARDTGAAPVSRCS